MHKIILLAFFSFLFQDQLSAQTEEATTASGRKVILSANGTWKYAEEKKSNIKKTTKEEDGKTVTPVTMDGCFELLESIEDSKTNIRITRSKNIIIASSSGGKKEISIMIQKGAKQVIMISLRPVGAGSCIGEGNKIHFYFTDGSKAELTNDGLTGCNGEASVNFGGPYGRKKLYTDIITKKIKSIKVWTQSGYVQQELSEENQREFFQLINCFDKH